MVQAADERLQRGRISVARRTIDSSSYGRGPVEDEVVVAELDVAGQPLVDVLGRAGGLVLPGLVSLGREQRVAVAERLGARVADGGHAHVDAALDGLLVAADRLAVLDEHAVRLGHPGR